MGGREHGVRWVLRHNFGEHSEIQGIQEMARVRDEG